MAIASVTLTKAKYGELVDAPALTAFGALSTTEGAYVASTDTYGAKIPFEGHKSGKVVLKIANTNSSAAANVRVVGGTNGVTGGNDLVVSVAASGEKLICLETGKYGHLEGEYKGFIVLTGAAATLKVLAVELPN